MTEDEYYLHSLGEEFKKQVEERIEKTLALNISHIKPSNHDKIVYEGIEDFPMRFAVHDHGIIFFVELGMEDSQCELDDNWFLANDMNEIMTIVRTARENNCSLINFDNAIPETDAFETFNDW